MKIRLGFVSNSSSSSFIAVLPKDKYQEIVKKFLTEHIDDITKFSTAIQGLVKPVVSENNQVMIHAGYNEDSSFINGYDVYNCADIDFCSILYSFLGNEIPNVTSFIYYIDG